MNKLLIKIPSRERGLDWIYSYLDNITNPNTKILLTLDHDYDIELLDKMDFFNRDLLNPHIDRVMIEVGESKGKIEAINRDINKYIDDYDVLLIGSDDMRPQVKGFDQIILDDMNANYPDGDGCLWYHTEDHQTELKKRFKKVIPPGSPQFLSNWICMMPVMGKNYYKRFNYVYHSSYKSFWCDNEQTEVARRLNKITYLHKGIVKHFHPAWSDKGVEDDLYLMNNKNWINDRDNFSKRQGRGFPTN